MPSPVDFAHAEGVGNNVLVLLIIVVVVVVVIEDVILKTVKQVSSMLMLEGDKCRTDRQSRLVMSGRYLSRSWVVIRIDDLLHQSHLSTTTTSLRYLRSGHGHGFARSFPSRLSSILIGARLKVDTGTDTQMAACNFVSWPPISPLGLIANFRTLGKSLISSSPLSVTSGTSLGCLAYEMVQQAAGMDEQDAMH